VKLLHNFYEILIGSWQLATYCWSLPSPDG